jgi:hypothetical protein
VAARRRVDIFFILYLTAIVGFIVVSKEREKSNTEMQEMNEQIVRTLIPPVPLHPERDTLRCYVDADSNGVVVGDPVAFRTRMYVRDISPEDDVTLSVHSVVYNETLTSPDLVSLGIRTAVGQVHDNIVAFPVAMIFPRTGRFDVNFTARAHRVHEVEDGVFTYRGIRFDTTLISRELIGEIEQSAHALTVIVQDTSIDVSHPPQVLQLSMERETITSAIGFEETNRIQTNLGWANPDVSLIRGGGSLRRISRSDRGVEYEWRGMVSSIPDTVTVEARVSRGAGGKDIARASFAVSGVLPFLPISRPEEAFSGEEINFDISVSGLDEPARYSWKMYEEAGQGSKVLKAEGRSPRVLYRIPNSFAGKTLIVDARYDGQPYRVYSRRSYVMGGSRFILRVIEPPTRIELAFPDRATVSSIFHFSASRYSNARFRGEQPIARLADVEVELRDQQNRELEVDVWMVRKGEFEFSLVNRKAVRKGGERVMLTIRAGGSTARRSLELF